MFNKPLPYLLPTVRLLQSCHCLLGVRIPSLVRNNSSRSGLVLLHQMKPWTPASIATSIPFRFLNEKTSTNAEEKNTVSVNSSSSSSDQNHAHVLNNQYSLTTDKDHSLDGKRTRLQDTSTGSPKKLSCVKLLDAFSSDSLSAPKLFSTVMDLWGILTYSEKFKLPYKNISEHPNFPNLCSEVMMAIPFMSNKFLVCSLYVFVTLKVNQKTRLIQTLLNACQQHVNTLKVVEISILVRCLKMMDSSKNVDALNSRLSLLTELKFETIKDVASLQNLMRAAPRHLRPKFELLCISMVTDSKQTLYSLILESYSLFSTSIPPNEKALEMIDMFTAAQCHYMFFVLAESNLHSKILLDSCSNKLINCLDQFSSGRILSLTGCCSTLLYFNKKLLSAVGDNIMNNINMWNTLEISMVLNNMTFLRFRYVPLLDYFADKIMQESYVMTAKNLATVSKVYSILNYLPEGKEDKFLKSLNTALDLHMNKIKERELLSIVHSFCLLGLVSPSAFNKVLEDTSRRNSFQKPYLNSIRLELLMELGRSPYSIQDLKEVNIHRNHSVIACHTFLKKYFENPILYKENMQFASCYFIDFVLTLDREQSKLVPTRDLQNFESSPNITRIAVLCCAASSFILGSLNPTGILAVKIRHLKSLGFTVMLIPVNQFKMLTDAKRVEFLKENLFKDISSNQDSVHGN